MAVGVIGTARTGLYAVIALWSLLTLILAAAFIGKTENEFNGYNEASVELLVSAILSLVLLAPLHLLFHRSRPEHLFSSTIVELTLLGVLWLMFLGGAAALSSNFMGTRCFGSSVCMLAHALEAFAWLAWISITALVVTVLVFMIRGMTTGRKRAWREPFHPTWSAGEKAAPGAHNGQPVMAAV